MANLKIDKTKLNIQKQGKTKRYPNLSTIIMVEDVLKKNSDKPLKITDLKQKMPKQIMHPTLKIILDYLFKSGKIMYGPKGIQWIYSEPAHLKKMMNNTLEI